MALEKTNAILLRRIPYGESSYILYLFTNKHGLIHCLAKGIRKQKYNTILLERGFLIELIVYVKPNRGLHTVGSIHVLNFYSTIRSNIIKCTVRDIAFETILLAISQPETHKELFDFFQKFLTHLQSSSEEMVYPFSLWLFFHRFLQHMGFGIEMEHCIACGSKVTEDMSLSVVKGGLECMCCCENKQDLLSLPFPVISYLRTGNPGPKQLKNTITPLKTKKITQLLSQYCRYHCGIQKEYKSLIFLHSLL